MVCAEPAATVLMGMDLLDGFNSAPLGDVLEGLIEVADEQLGRSITSEEACDAIASLIGLGLVEVTGQGLAITQAGAAIVKPTRRLKAATRIKRIASALTAADEPGATRWVLPDDEWALAREAVARRRLDRARHALHLVEGLARAARMGSAIVELAQASTDGEDLRRELMAEPFAFSEVQAVHVMDMTVRTFCEAGRESLERRVKELRADMTELEATQAS